MLAFLSDAVGVLAGAGIRQWVRLTGRRVARRDAPWLDCPMGPRGRIGAGFYALLAQREHLHIRPCPDRPDAFSTGLWSVSGSSPPIRAGYGTRAAALP